MLAITGLMVQACSARRVLVLSESQGEHSHADEGLGH
jgi:hypothetical protein